MAAGKSGRAKPGNHDGAEIHALSSSKVRHALALSPQRHNG
jgi:hypothetical protein